MVVNHRFTSIRRDGPRLARTHFACRLRKVRRTRVNAEQTEFIRLVADKFSPVRDIFEANFASGADVGASCCATVEGETIVDLYSGFSDLKNPSVGEGHHPHGLFHYENHDCTHRVAPR